MHIQETITEIQRNKKAHSIRKKNIKFKLLLEGFDSACRSSNSTHRGVRSLSNFKAKFSPLKMAATASRIVEKDT
jgi:hypothetical protein